EDAEQVCSASVVSPEGPVGRKQSAGGSPDGPVLASADWRLPTDVPDILSFLVDKSLVHAEEHDGDLRYRLLDTIRQYARERLRESGEEEQTRDRHLGFFLALAEAAHEQLRGAEAARWFARLEAEHDNLRTALELPVASCQLSVEERPTD